MSTLNDYLAQKRAAIEQRKANPASAPHVLQAQVKAEGRSGVRRIRIRQHQVISDSPTQGERAAGDLRRAVLAVAGAAVLWSTGGLFIKLAPMPALAVACGRSLIAGLFYLALLRPNLRAARWTTAACRVHAWRRAKMVTRCLSCERLVLAMG